MSGRDPIPLVSEALGLARDCPATRGQQNPSQWRGANAILLADRGPDRPRLQGWRWHLSGVHQVAGRVIGPEPSAPLLIYVPCTLQDGEHAVKPKQGDSEPRETRATGLHSSLLVPCREIRRREYARAPQILTQRIWWRGRVPQLPPHGSGVFPRQQMSRPSSQAEPRSHHS